MRTVLFYALIVIALVSAFIGTTMPLMLPRQAADDRLYYQQFQAAAAYVNKNGHLPTGQAIEALRPHSNEPSIWSSLTTEPLDCDPEFAKAPTDKLVLSFWRGEWSECFASPSGRTTLSMSVTGYLVSGLWRDLAVYWVVALVSFWLALRLRRHWRAVRTT